MNVRERTLTREGSRVPLTPRMFDLLAALVRAGGRLLTKDELLGSVWADAAVEEGNLNRTISSLRKALGQARGERTFIETVPKVGYRFVAPVETAGAPARPISLKEGNTSPGPPAQTGPAGSRWLLRLSAFGAFGLLFGSLVGAYLFFPRAAQRTAPEPRRNLVKLTDGSFDEDQAAFTADGRIRFIRFVTGTRAESWVMSADGTGARRANEAIKSLRTGSWSPDEKRVVFTKDAESPRNVYLANADGTEERRLPLDYPPNDWSPDGTKLLFTKTSANNTDIYVYEIATGRSTNITDHASFDADPLFSPDGTSVVFTSDRDGNKECYIIEIASGRVQRLTDHPAVDAFPVISPDGTQVAFSSNRDNENSDIYIKDIASDRPPVKLTGLPSNEEQRRGCWSPDGTKLVITSDRDGKNSVYVIDAEPVVPAVVAADPAADLSHPSVSPDGAKLLFERRGDDLSIGVRIRDTRSGSEREVFSAVGETVNFSLLPTFSPDASKIAFTGKVDNNTEIFIVNADGRGLRNLTNDPAADASPSFSADGQSVYFHSNRDGQYEMFHLFRVDLGSGNVERVTGRKGYEFSPAVSPADDEIYFSGDRLDAASRSLDIRALHVDTPDKERLVVSRRLHDTLPAVSPDGRLIAFVSQSDGDPEIYLVNSDGSGLVRLTRNAGVDTTPAFSADGLSVLFASDRTGKFAIYSLPVPSSSPVSSR